MGNIRYYFTMAIVLVVSLIATPVLAGGHGAKSGPSEKKLIPGGDTINLSGMILDSHKEPVGEAEVLIQVNGKEVDLIETESNGKYVSRFQLEKDKIQSSLLSPS